jgi:hypothetical protein
MRERRCAAGLQRAEEKFRRVKSYGQIGWLLDALDACLPLDVRPATA